MTKFINPEKGKDITITVNGEEKKIKLKKDDYFYLDDAKTGKIVIKNAILDKIARENNIFIKDIKLEFTNISPEKFYIVYRAYFDMDGIEQSILGEANSSNLDSFIGAQYPFTMAETRATSRAFIKALHLKEQGVYSDCEFSDISKEEQKNKEQTDTQVEDYVYASDTDDNCNTSVMTKEEAAEVICNVGFYANNPKPIKDVTDRSRKWILAQNTSDENFRKIQNAIKIYTAA